ncbi:hypothetical protein MKW94_003323 [Papaver nudicaule]|uniref:Uncharacterized protein n=1 Tax=Papaver nudicaule TaxID=74823 RepID=A0AA42ASX6_PAPNU|nr:hypothetical protein [Papaver nudicaule]
MSKTASLCFAPLFLYLMFISAVLMSSQGVNGETTCVDWSMDTFQLDKYGVCREMCKTAAGIFRVVSYELHDIWSFDATKCACCWEYFL